MDQKIDYFPKYHTEYKLHLTPEWKEYKTKHSNRLQFDKPHAVKEYINFVKENDTMINKTSTPIERMRVV